MLQVNCTILQVTLPSAGEAYDGPVAAGTPLYVAPADPAPNAYLIEKRERKTEAQGADTIIDRVLLVPMDLGFDWDREQHVTIELADMSTITATVEAVQIPRIIDPEISPEVITGRLTLKPPA